MNRHCSTNDPQATRHHCSTPCCFNPHYSGNSSFTRSRNGENDF
ncbi:hypothetical protein HanXRQr2_Chr14g0638391 [Helianthus annuus]|uniref:Uncharacterized protein n=1 Tax=Helianthus annuus TaxID=4232 RepID=A0A9K3H760_HELAN|nr:hypothetical protein HanXRQr2_Chr14g0638391 [Helianthus annuus]KAJ0839909.1 hypothetical protein HanPSC8_Chr14g0612341 [Helianthus annuus]